MDGLSLLGMVAEQRLGEGDGTEHGYSKAKAEDGVKWEQEVRPEDVKVEPGEGMEEGEDPAASEFQSSTSNIAVRSDLGHSPLPENSHGFLKVANQHYEKSSQAVATHLNVHNFNTPMFSYKIIENQLCKFSKYTGWHLQRSTGMMKIKLNFHGITTKGPMLVRALLVRKDETYRHFGVDRVCENHRKEVSWAGQEHVLQAAAGLEGMWQYGSRGPRRSLCFMVGSPGAGGDLEETIGLRCICNDSCSTCDDQTFKQTESSRDLLLVLTLESLEYGMILARRSIGVWPKAVVRPKDLNKPERRKPKGGAAKLNKMREMLELGLPYVPAASAPAAAPPPPKNIQRVALGNSSVFKIAPKMPVMTSRLPPSSNSSKQTFNILLPVESRHGIPTTQELMDTTIGLAIKNARTLGITNEQFIARIQIRLMEADLAPSGVVRTTTVTSSSASVKTVSSPVPLAMNTFSLKTVSSTLPLTMNTVPNGNATLKTVPLSMSTAANGNATLKTVPLAMNTVANGNAMLKAVQLAMNSVTNGNVTFETVSSTLPLAMNTVASGNGALKTVASTLPFAMNNVASRNVVLKTVASNVPLVMNSMNTVANGSGTLTTVHSMGHVATSTASSSSITLNTVLSRSVPVSTSSVTLKSVPTSAIPASTAPTNTVIRTPGHKSSLPLKTITMKTVSVPAKEG